MAGKPLDGLRVAILVTDGFEEVELTKPRQALQDAGATATIVSPHPGTVQGMNHDEKADKLDVGMTLDEADPDDFDAALLPGASRTPTNYALMTTCGGSCSAFRRT
jgi:protease I